MLSYEHICKTFNPGTPDAVTLFDDFNLTVDDGEFVSIIGSNGSGKTTMLNLLCGSLPVDSGRILVDGSDITNLAEYRRAAHIGRVFRTRRRAHAVTSPSWRIWRLPTIKSGVTG